VFKKDWDRRDKKRNRSVRWGRLFFITRLRLVILASAQLDGWNYLTCVHGVDFPTSICELWNPPPSTTTWGERFVSFPVGRASKPPFFITQFPAHDLGWVFLLLMGPLLVFNLLDTKAYRPPFSYTGDGLFGEGGSYLFFSEGGNNRGERKRNSYLGSDNLASWG